MKAVYLLVLAIPLVGILALSFYKIKLLEHQESENNNSYVYSSKTAQKNFPPIPVLRAGGINSPDLTAESVLVIDVNSGVSLYEKNPDEKLLPASTTKIITALVALDHYKLNDVIKVGKMDVVGQKMGLVEHEEITVEDLISGMMIYSANDAAEALANAFPGGRELFVDAMNDKARQLNLDNTLFTNPSGLDGLGLKTTARDLARESVVAMQIPFFKQVVGTKEKLVTSVDGIYKHKLTNINELVGEVPGVLGIKTGWTENAKENLVSYVERDGHEVVFVVLKSSDRFGETKSLIEWVYGNFEWKKVSI